MKKLLRTSVVVTLVLLPGSVGNAGVLWTDVGADHLWSNADNWSTGVPTINDVVAIDVPAAAAPNGPVIQAGIDAKAKGIQTSVAGVPTLTMTGGSLEVDDYIWWGDGAGSYAHMSVSGGTIDVHGTFELGWGDGAGTLVVTGGTVSSERTRFPTSTGAFGRLYLYDGTYNVTNFDGLEVRKERNGIVDIYDGTLVLEGDDTGKVLGYIDEDAIVAFGGTGSVLYDYDVTNPLKTTVWAVSGHSTLTWNGLGNATWAALYDDPPNNSHWLVEGAPTTAYPDDAPPGIIADAVINADVITVAEDRMASSLMVTRDPGNPNPVGVEIAGGASPDVAATLTLQWSADLGPGTTLTMGQNATFQADSGSIDAVTTSGDATINSGRNLSVASFTDGTVGTFTKGGQGKLSLDNSSGTGVSAANTVFRVVDGVLESTGPDPLGGASGVSLGGGGLSVIDAPDMTGTRLTVTADSTLAALTAAPASFGSLTIDGTLTTSSAFQGISFIGTTIPQAATAVGFDTLVDTNLGLLDANSAQVTITKKGRGDLVLDEANVHLENATFAVQEGRLIGVHGSNPFDRAAIHIDGGEVVLASKTGLGVAFDNALTSVGNTSALTAGVAVGGLPGPLTVTLGSATNGVTVQSGTLTLKTTDQYDLLVDGNLSGPGAGVKLVEGTVTLAHEANVGSVRIEGGTLIAGADVSVGTMEVSGGTLSGTVNTGANRVIVGQSLKLGRTTFSLADAPSFSARGSDLLAGADVTLGGGTLTVSRPAQLDILFVSRFANLSYGGDRGVYDFLTNDLEHNVTAVSDLAAQPGDAEGKDLVLISATVRDFLLDTKFTDMDPTFEPMAIPTIQYDNGLVDEFGFSPSHEPVQNADTLVILQPDHPMAAGLSGNVLVRTSRNLSMHTVSAHPGDSVAPDGIVIAYDPAYVDPEHPLIFLVEQGGLLNNGMTASANRIHFFLDNWGFTDATGDSFALFEAAVDYAAGGEGSRGLIDVPTTNFAVEAPSTLHCDTPVDAILGNLTLAPAATLEITGAGAGFQDVTTGHDGTIVGNVAVRGNLNIGGSAGLLTVNGGVEFGENATYNVEIAEWDSPGGLPPLPPLPAAPMDPTINDRLHASAGDVYLDGELKLTALSKLHPRVPHPDPPHVEVEWYGDQTRVILSTEGESEVGWTFAVVPDPQPQSWDTILTGTPEWSRGHIGRGVFLTRQNDGGDNDVPGISYGINSTKLHLFQACDGDTNGDRTLGGRDVQNIQSFALFGVTEDPGPGYVWPPDWPQGDFDGDGLVTGLDISAILATGLWPTAGYAAVEPGEQGDQVVDLLLYASDYSGPDYPPGEAGTLIVSTEGVTINGYLIRSEAAIFDGEPAASLGWFVEDTDAQISDHMGFLLKGDHLLGKVIGPDWLIVGKGQPVDPYQDITFNYTVEGTPGLFAGNLIVVPEPGTLWMLLCTGALGLLLLGVRQRRVKFPIDL